MYLGHVIILYHKSRGFVSVVEYAKNIPESWLLIIWNILYGIAWAQVETVPFLHAVSVFHPLTKPAANQPDVTAAQQAAAQLAATQLNAAQPNAGQKLGLVSNVVTDLTSDSGTTAHIGKLVRREWKFAQVTLRGVESNLPHLFDDICGSRHSLAHIASAMKEFPVANRDPVFHRNASMNPNFATSVFEPTSGPMPLKGDA